MVITGKAAEVGFISLLADAISNDRLTPDEKEAIIAVTTFDDWLKRSNPTRPSDKSRAKASLSRRVTIGSDHV